MIAKFGLALALATVSSAINLGADETPSFLRDETIALAQTGDATNERN